MTNSNYWLYFDSCKLCFSSNRKILYTAPFTSKMVWSFLENFYQTRLNKVNFANVNFTVAKCQNCGFIWQTNILGPKGMQMLYEKWIDPKKSFNLKTMADINLYRFTSADVLSINSLVKKPPHQVTILDFGFGWGTWALFAKASGFDVYGIELSKKRLQHGKEIGLKVAKSISELKEVKFDFIHTEQVFEHLPEPLKTLKELVELLKPGGIIYISVPNGKSVEADIQKPGWRLSKGAIFPPEHINSFTRHTLEVLAKNAGLKRISPPFVSIPNATPYELLRNIGGHLYQRTLSTSMYFKKT